MREKEINLFSFQISICINVVFNFLLLSQKHPFGELFSEIYLGPFLRYDLNMCDTQCQRIIFEMKHVQIMFIKMSEKSKFSLVRVKREHFVKIPFIIFRLAGLDYTGQTSYLDMVYPSRSSFFRKSYLSRDWGWRVKTRFPFLISAFVTGLM